MAMSSIKKAEIKDLAVAVFAFFVASGLAVSAIKQEEAYIGIPLLALAFIIAICSLLFSVDCVQKYHGHE